MKKENKIEIKQILDLFIKNNLKGFNFFDIKDLKANSSGLLVNYFLDKFLNFHLKFSLLNNNNFTFKTKFLKKLNFNEFELENEEIFINSLKNKLQDNKLFDFKDFYIEILEYLNNYKHIEIDFSTRPNLFLFLGNFDTEINFDENLIEQIENEKDEDKKLEREINSIKNFKIEIEKEKEKSIIELNKSYDNLYSLKEEPKESLESADEEKIKEKIKKEEDFDEKYEKYCTTAEKFAYIENKLMDLEYENAKRSLQKNIDNTEKNKKIINDEIEKTTNEQKKNFEKIKNEEEKEFENTEKNFSKIKKINDFNENYKNSINEFTKFSKKNLFKIYPIRIFSKFILPFKYVFDIIIEKFKELDEKDIELDKRIDNLEKSIKNINSKLNDIDKILNSLNNSINIINSNINNLNSNFSSLNNNVNNLNSNINSRLNNLDNKVQILDSKMNSAENKISILETDNTSNKMRIKKLEDDFKDLEERVEDIEKKI